MTDARKELSLAHRVRVLGDAQPLLAVPPPATGEGFVGQGVEGQPEGAGARKKTGEVVSFR